jgi:thiol-disulfide isomerase/thioredoxin/outer membrane lipoprotein-sorting protein
MKNLNLFAAIIFFSLLSFSTTNAAPEDRWLNGASGYARALELQRELKVPLIVYFYADWCPFCRRLDSEYLPSAPVQQYLRGVVKVRINPENGPAEDAIAQQYGVTGYPTFLVMRNLSTPPRNIQPFRKGGANLTPAEWVTACERAASFAAPGTNISRAPVEVAQPKVKAQIVEVPSSSGPMFINDPEPPTLDAVLTKYVTAIGGRDAQRRITSRVSKGRVDVPGVSFGGKLEIYAKAPNKSLTIMDVEPAGLVKQGFDGRTVWTNRSDTGNGIERAALVDADFYREIKLKEQYTRIKLLGKVKEGFRQVYLVEAVPRSGAAENLYFDAETGLLVRRDVPRRTAKGIVLTEVYFSDWRDVDGVKVPFRITQAIQNTKFVITLEDVKQNVPVDDAIFLRP